jgi:putative transposase
MCESFFATLECELLNRRTYKTIEEAKLDDFDYIEGWYNTRRRHSGIEYPSPAEYERLNQKTA